MSPQLLQRPCWGEVCWASGRWWESALAPKCQQVCKAYFHLFPVSVALGHHLSSVVQGTGFQLSAGQERGDFLPQPLTFPWAAWWDRHPRHAEAALPTRDAAPAGAEGSR